jgi:hypothetical protein
MRYSRAKRHEVVEKDVGTNEAFLKSVAKETKPLERQCGILLIGGSNHTGITLRAAQAPLRFDQRPSYWSHAAIILRWDKNVRQAIGAEVALEPADPALQVPERNGVTLFELARLVAAAHRDIRTPAPAGRRGIL